MDCQPIIPGKRCLQQPNNTHPCFGKPVPSTLRRLPQPARHAPAPEGDGMDDPYKGIISKITSSLLPLPQWEINAIYTTGHMREDLQESNSTEEMPHIITFRSMRVACRLASSSASPMTLSQTTATAHLLHIEAPIT